MPGQNHRGPFGEGPRTGRARGTCGGDHDHDHHQEGALVVEEELPELDLAKITIAVPTADGVNVSPHLGRSSAFVLVDIEEGAVASRRETTLRAGPHGGSHHDHDAHHDTIRAALEGTELVLAKGAGRRIVADLDLAGIRVESAAAPTIEGAIEAFLEGRRAPIASCGGRGHGHGHHHGR